MAPAFASPPAVPPLSAQPCRRPRHPRYLPALALDSSAAGAARFSPTAARPGALKPQEWSPEHSSEPHTCDADPPPPGPARRGSAWLGRRHSAESREKISAANKGNVPWNKGRRHSEETRRKIAERTRQAMLRPEVQERLKASGAQLVKTRSAMTPDQNLRTRDNIRAQAMIRAAIAAADGDTDAGAKRLRAIEVAADVTPFEWPANLVRTVAAGLRSDWARLEYRVSLNAANPNGSKDRPKPPASRSSRTSRRMSPEAKAKLAERIREKWKDPAYRQRVRDGMRLRLEETRASGSPARQLSEEHRQRIRQSLLARYEKMREQGTLPSREESRRRRQERDRGRVRTRPRALTEDERLARAEVREAHRAELIQKRKARRAQEHLRAQEEENRRREERQLVRDLVASGALPRLESTRRDLDDASASRDMEHRELSDRGQGPAPPSPHNWTGRSSTDDKREAHGPSLRHGDNESTSSRIVDERHDENGIVGGASEVFAFTGRSEGESGEGGRNDTPDEEFDDLDDEEFDDDDLFDTDEEGEWYDDEMDYREYRALSPRPTPVRRVKMYHNGELVSVEADEIAA